MKPRHERFAKQTGNLHDQTGRSVRLCPRCKEPVPPRPGFRVAALACPKCGAAMGKVY